MTHSLQGHTDTSDGFVRPQSSSTRPRINTTANSSSSSNNNNTTIKKASSYQNLKLSSATVRGKHNSSTLTASDRLLASKRNTTVATSKQTQHGSTANLPEACTKKPSTVCTQSHLNNCNNEKYNCNVHRISVNSDLLSRVEKEKKQYETRISELTQVAETRKMEIEKLTFEVRRSKVELTKAERLVDDLKSQMDDLRARINDVGTNGKVDDATLRSNITGCTNSPSVAVRKSTAFTQSPPESLGTTTRLTPGGATTGNVGAVTTSSLGSDWNDRAPSFDFGGTAGSINDDELTELIDVATKPGLTVDTLQGRLVQMEEANYTTNEELQATLQELWDLQRRVDEAHEETHGLAFERAILLEALSTQTTKLEHCRFQIDQLKHLLLTDRDAMTPGTRESNFCELYESIEQEKQVLLAQNNELAQSSDGWAKECRRLTEKATVLQDTCDTLETDHSDLKAAYQSAVLEIAALKSRCDGLKERPGGDEPCPTDGLSETLPQQLQLCPSERIADVVQSTTTTSAVVATGSAIESCRDSELREITDQHNLLKEKIDRLEAEHERDKTEWRLYERDLLKTVQVADSIKNEAEQEARRLTVENQTLATKVSVME